MCGWKGQWPISPQMEQCLPRAPRSSWGRQHPPRHTAIPNPRVLTEPLSLRRGGSEGLRVVSLRGFLAGLKGHVGKRQGPAGQVAAVRENPQKSTVTLLDREPPRFPLLSHQRNSTFPLSEGTEFSAYVTVFATCSDVCSGRVFSTVGHGIHMLPAKSSVCLST